MASSGKHKQHPRKQRQQTRGDNGHGGPIFIEKTNQCRNKHKTAIKKQQQPHEMKNNFIVQLGHGLHKHFFDLLNRSWQTANNNTISCDDSKVT